METIYPAHIKVEPGKADVTQSVPEHLLHTAEYCAMRLQGVGLESTGYFLGIVHDMGKMYAGFKQYIEDATAGKPVIKGSVNHTFAAVKLIFKMFHPAQCGSTVDIAAEIIAYALAAHHGAVDLCDREGNFGFTHRIEYDEKVIGYEEAEGAFFSSVVNKDEFVRRFRSAEAELIAVLNGIFAGDDRNEGSFACGMLARLLLSALIDADRRDTAEFLSGREFAGDERHDEEKNRFWPELLEGFNEKISRFKANSPINIARAYISDACAESAASGAEIYRLTVPTGAGKTLSALRYALNKAVLSGKRRIIYIIPLLSVIEQNAGVFKEYLGSDMVLEHHSNVYIEPSDDVLREKYITLTQGWDAPVIVSTMVQLLNTLFDASGSCVRRMNALCNSVLIIDEIQSLPRKTVSLFNSAINFLSKYCNTTVVLCSATQPVLEETAHPIRLSENADMVPENREIWRSFERTRLIDLTRPSGYTYEQVAEKAEDIISETKSLLIICNTKAAVRQICALLKEYCEQNDIFLFHLSAAMCMAHRKQALINIGQPQEGNRRVICVSSQLVEAGVDFSFDCVIRSLSGLDNIAQAAGRCNRNGKATALCPVYIMNFTEENLRMLPDIRHAQNAFEGFAALYRADSGFYSDSMLSSRSVQTYYQKLFADVQVSRDFEYPCPEAHSDLYTMLAENVPFIRSKSRTKPSSYFLNQAFKTAGKHFKVFDDQTTDIIVPYSADGKKLVEELCSERAVHDMNYLAERIKKASAYSVSVFEYQKKLLYDNGALFFDENRPFLILKDRFYNDMFGLDISGGARENCIL